MLLLNVQPASEPTFQADVPHDLAQVVWSPQRLQYSLCSW